MEEPEQEEDEGGGGGGLNIAVVKSYLSFAARSIRTRLVLVGVVACFGLALTLAAYKLFPRTYKCTTILMTMSNPVLDGDRGYGALNGANGMVMRHSNLEDLIKEIDLVKKYKQRRPTLLAWKDKVMEALSGPLDDKTMVAVLVGTLETKLSVGLDGEGNLNISTEWTDAASAAEITEAAREGFLRMRHSIEISAFEEKMAILDSHATKLRAEIDSLAETMKAAAEAKAAEATKTAAKTPTTVAAPAPRVVRRAPVADSELPLVQAKLAALKVKLDAAENERKSRIREEKAKLDELKLRLTPNHPQVVTQEERVAMASQVSSDLAMMRADAADLEAQVHQREAQSKMGGGGGGLAGSAPGSGAAEGLPMEVMALVGREDVDPALSAQISGAVVRYGALRDEVRAGKISLDTAQAAFNHRYQVIVPVDVPNKPIKPKGIVILGAGVVVSLLIALLIPNLLHLRNGVIVELWQVHTFQLPVLGELRLPPRSGS
jgi:uncharacterized protein involved in exopolysaccharide biosynthesis